MRHTALTQSPATGRFTFKHVVLATALALGCTQGLAADLVRNGGVEPWDAFIPWGWGTSAPYEGERTNSTYFASLRNQTVSDAYGVNIQYGKHLMVFNTAETGYSAVSRGVYQHIGTLKANTEYQLTFKARSQGTTPVDFFVQVANSLNFASAGKNAVVTRRIRAKSGALETYTVNFKTGDNNPGEHYLAFLGKNFGNYNSNFSGLVGITDVSLTDTLPVKAASVFYPAGPTPNKSIPIEIRTNQVGYLGKGKPFVFNVLNWPMNSGWGFSAFLTRNGKKIMGTDGDYINASVSASSIKVDPESGDTIATVAFDTSLFPSTLSDDVDTPPANSYNAADFRPTSPNSRNTGYQIEIYNPYVQTNGKTSTFSAPFAISKNLYNKLPGDALAYFDNNLAGMDAQSNTMDRPGENTTGRYAGHAASDKVATCRGGLDKFGALSNNDFSTMPCYTLVNGVKTPLTLDVSGGWYDAGDQGKYVVNGGVSLWTLQNMIERLQKKADTFARGTSQRFNAVNQIFQRMWQTQKEMDFFLRMQAPANTWAVVPSGYQGANLSATGRYGYYQTNLEGTAKLADDAQGAITFKGGNLPKLAIKLELAPTDVSGMAFHAVHDEKWTAIPTLPSADKEKRLLAYPTSAATLNLAAVGAQCSRIWSWPGMAEIYSDKNVPLAYATRCLTAATSAWDAAKAKRDANKDIYRYEYSNESWAAVDKGTGSPNNAVLANGFALGPQFDGGGAYGDYRLRDEFYWAGMELYLASAAKGDTTASTAAATKYLGTIKAELKGTTDAKTGVWSSCEDSNFPAVCYAWVSGFDWQNVTALGTLSAVTADANRWEGAKNLLSAETSTQASSATLSINNVNYSATPRFNLIQLAKALRTQTNAQAYRFAKPALDITKRETQYEWGSNGSVLNRAIVLAVAADLTGDKSFADSANLSMDYILGRNANGVSYVTGYGVNAVRYPHHRHWAKLANPAFPQAQDGALVGGPNSRDIESIFANAKHTVANSVDAADVDNAFFINTVASACMNYKRVNSTINPEVINPVFAPQKCFADTYHSFATSEVAINWNAPLSWVSQYLAEYGQQ